MGLVVNSQTRFEPQATLPFQAENLDQRTYHPKKAQTYSLKLRRPTGYSQGRNEIQVHRKCMEKEKTCFKERMRSRKYTNHKKKTVN